MKKNIASKIDDSKNASNIFLFYYFLKFKIVLLILMFSCSFIKLSAQTRNNNAPKIMEVTDYISSLKANTEKTKMNSPSAQYLENIVYGIQDAIYFELGKVRNYGDHPVKLFTDIASLKSIPSQNIVKDGIEIVVIKISNSSDLNSKIDLLEFSNFSKLKYIYILSNINITYQSISTMFINYTDQYNIFYKVKITE